VGVAEGGGQGLQAGAKLARSGVLRIVTVVATLVASAALFFASAGTLELRRGWIYYGGLLAYLVAALALLFVAFPGAIEVVNERGRFRKDVKAWDKAFGVAYTALLLALPAVAGLDAGRFHWSEAPEWPAWPALAVSLLAYAVAHWAMIANRFLETGVRVQSDRRHEVVSSGPYRFVRHPFYVSVCLANLVYPLAVGALWAFVPALLIVALLVWRTAREDETLRRELPGYEAYAARTRHRLIPGVW
jgi:protein-S-isoprenylcysteine O-methyltransferase Ste14